jgi:hypothetical protein
MTFLSKKDYIHLIVLIKYKGNTIQSRHNEKKEEMPFKNISKLILKT